MLNREQILGATKLRVEKVSVPEWNGEVLVRELTGRERDEFESSLVVKEGKQTTTTLANIRAKLVARAIVDENGIRVLSDDDVEWLGSRSAAALNRVFDVARRLSGLTEEDVEDLTKNSSPGQSGSSTTALPGTSAGVSTKSSTATPAAS